MCLQLLRFPKKGTVVNEHRGLSIGKSTQNVVTIVTDVFS